MKTCFSIFENLTAGKPNRRYLASLVFLLSLLAASISASAIAASTAQEAFEGSGATPIENYIHNAMILNMTEIEAGNLAQKNSRSGHVQTFAQRMVRHHTAINQRLVGLANQKDIPIPDTASVVKSAQAGLKALKASSSFDRDYADNQIASHESAITFLTHADALEDEDIKLWARETLAKVYDHLANAKALRDQVSPERVQAEQQELDGQP